MNQDRQTRMTIDLGDDRVELERIHGEESMSTLFSYAIEIRSPLEIDMEPHMGKPAAISITEDGALQRHFNGLVVSSEFLSQSTAGCQYRLILRPWAYWLAQNRNMAIFQEMTAVDIIKKVFGDAGVTDVEYQLSETYLKRVYCVQYQESDFAFVSRLMEEEGIFYFFRHEKDRHVMVIGDKSTTLASGKPGKLTFSATGRRVSGTNASDREQLFQWRERVSSTGEAKVSFTDFDFSDKKLRIGASTTEPGKHPQDVGEIYHYPGGFQRDLFTQVEEEKIGKTKTRVRLEERRAERRIFTGITGMSGLSAGTMVSVAGHPAGRMNARYLIIRVNHALRSEVFRSGDNENEHDQEITFEAIPADTPYHPPVTTPRPTVQGLESAIVVGPANETIHTDEFGRVKVHFHWDRKGKMDANATCWIRVSQTGLLGNQILPRVGHEVLIDFLNGDPDRPVIVGRVYNAANMPHYKLPAEKTKAVWRTLRYGDTGDYTGAEKLDTDGNSAGANELRFEDKGGYEEVFLHAERDMNVRVRWQETHHVGHDQFIKVGHNREYIVKLDEKIEIGQNRTEEVKKDEKVEIGGNQELKVTGNRKSAITGKEDRDVTGAYKLQSPTSIELISGGSSIKIDPSGITLKGMAIKIEGGMTAEMKSVMTTVNASGILTLKGGLTMIN